MRLRGIDEERIKKSDIERRRDRSALQSAIRLINGDDSAVKKTVELARSAFVHLESQSG